MRASLNELEQIEHYLLKNKSSEDTVLFEAKLILYPELHEKLLAQQETYTCIQNYGRSSIKKEIEAVHQKLFTDSPHKTFLEKIARIFPG